EKVYGFAYIDDEMYEFYDKDYNLLKTVPHDFGVCPATFVVYNRFYPESSEKDPDGIVKESIFSYVREDLEWYTILKTFQKLTDVNGAFPIVTMLDVKTESKEGEDFDALPNEPMSVSQL